MSNGYLLSARHSNEVMSCIQQASALALKTLEKDSTFQSLCRGYIFDKLGLIPKGTIGDYTKSIGQMQKFLAVLEVFSLFLFHSLTKQVPQLVSLLSSVEEMLSF